MSRERLDEVTELLAELGLPRAQLNDRSAVTLLALLDLPPAAPWKAAQSPMRGITPIMEWAKANYGLAYAPNTRETFRRQTMHQFVQAGLVVLNPDDATRPVNSPKTVYQIEPSALELLRAVRSPTWKRLKARYLGERESLVAKYQAARAQHLVPVHITDDATITLSPGEHSALIRAVVEDFAPRFVPGATLIYVGDTGDKWGHFDRDRLARLGVEVDGHGKMPDVILYDTARHWLILAECVTSHGPVDAKRHRELAALFADSTAGLVFVSAFATRSGLAKYLAEISWETEVWVEEAPSHLIHFNGVRFLGPYSD